ncbi:uncharacterized protein LOC119828799 isoform X2 [Zerene cesonia]|uniref:uncharacterized protein LOC119828799 isoform X2 n=1 Tax=Zerene cesonia TaxID=33412 RepID=UPI0018E4E5EF|nr:uncharacterized protein LOC119828799 isoform X2 [Zerene cesonia]
MSATQAEEESAVEEVGAIGSAPARNTYREKSASTVVRVLTVFAYLFSVSFAAILLSVYYICVWKSPELTEAQGQVSEVSARRADDFDYRPTFTGDNETFNFTGRSNTSVNEYIAQSTIENITSFMNTNESLSSTEDWLSNATATSMQDNSTTYDDSDSLHINNVT